MGSPRKHEWERRPALAKLVRTAAWVVPIVASLGAALAVSFLLTRPEGLGLLVWWAAVAAGATVTLVAFEPLCRRAVTLATLLELSLVFPSSAPSRSFVALRASSSRRLEIRLIKMSTHDGLANSRVAERMALASALGVLRQQRLRPTGRALVTGGAFVLSAALITGTVLFPAPTQAPPSHRPAGPPVAAPAPVAGVPPSPGAPEGTERATSPTPTPTPVAGSSNRVAGPTSSSEVTRGESKPPGVASSSPSLGPTPSADMDGGSAPPAGGGPNPANAVAAAPGGAVVIQRTQPLAVASGQSAGQLATEPRLPAAAQTQSQLPSRVDLTERTPDRTSGTAPAPSDGTGGKGGSSAEAGSAEAGSPAATPPNRTVTSRPADSDAKTVGVSASREEGTLPVGDVDAR